MHTQYTFLIRNKDFPFRYFAVCYVQVHEGGGVFLRAIRIKDDARHVSFFVFRQKGRIMSIEITGRKFTVSESLKKYALEKIGSATKVMDLNPLTIEVVLYTEKNPSNPKRCCCEVTLRAKQHVIRVEEQEEDMYAASDVAAAKLVRQLRKYKTRVVDRRILGEERGAQASRTNAPVAFDADAIMQDLYAEEDEIVRVKTMEFAPMTQEEALVQIDLLGHDFFAYTDRDTGAVCVLYRRDAGGYGLLMQSLN